MTLLSNAVKIANSVTKSLKFQSKVSHETYVNDAGIGAPTYTTKSRDAVVEQKQRQVRTFSGELAVSSMTVLFLVPTTVGPHDRIFLADGTGGAVIGTGGPVDASGQLITEAYLG